MRGEAPVVRGGGDQAGWTDLVSVGGRRGGGNQTGWTDLVSVGGWRGGGDLAGWADLVSVGDWGGVHAACRQAPPLTPVWDMNGASS